MNMKRFLDQETSEWMEVLNGCCQELDEINKSLSSHRNDKRLQLLKRKADRLNTKTLGKLKEGLVQHGSNIVEFKENLFSRQEDALRKEHKRYKKQLNILTQRMDRLKSDMGLVEQSETNVHESITQPMHDAFNDI